MYEYSFVAVSKFIVYQILDCAFINTHCFQHYFSSHSDHLAKHLWKAASNDGHDREVLELLQRGAPPDCEYYQRVHQGQSPLWIACCYRHLLSAEYLLKWGASVTTTTDSGSTPLHISYDTINCVRLLLEHHSPTGKPGVYSTDFDKRMYKNHNLIFSCVSELYYPGKNTDYISFH